MISSIENTCHLTFVEEEFVSEDGQIKSYIEFLIDGVPLADLIGNVEGNIGKFGWSVNLDYELSELEELAYKQKSKHENSLFSIYVCSECADEGCGAIMFVKEQNEQIVVWRDFVQSDGIDDIDSTHSKYNCKPIKFKKEEYLKSMEELRYLILKMTLK